MTTHIIKLPDGRRITIHRIDKISRRNAAAIAKAIPKVPVVPAQLWRQ